MKNRVHLIVRIIFGPYPKLPCQDPDNGVPRHQQHLMFPIGGGLEGSSRGNDLVIGLVFLQIVPEMLPAWFRLDSETTVLILSQMFQFPYDFSRVPSDIRFILQLIQFFQDYPRYGKNRVITAEGCQATPDRGPERLCPPRLSSFCQFHCLPLIPAPH